MDGRAKIALALAFSLGLVGCVPGANKLTSVEGKNQPTSSKPEVMETTTASFFSPPKREPNVEIALGVWHERKAAGTVANTPEVQFRELDEARKVYQEVLNYDPKNLEAFRGLGRVYVAMKDYPRAQANYQKALEKHPKQASLFADQSIIYSKRDDFRGAIALLNKALEIDPENQDYLKMIGVNMLCAGQEERGIEMLSRARGKAAAHYYAARLYHRKNQDEMARRQLQMALQANPNFTEAQTFALDLNGPGNRPAEPRNLVGLEFVSDEK